MERIRRLAHRLQFVAKTAMFLTVVAWIWAVLRGRDWQSDFADLQIPAQIPAAATISSFGIALISLALVLLLLWQIAALLGRYRDGDVLSYGCAERIGYAGWCLVAMALLSVISDAVLSLALTAGNPPGQRSLSINLSSSDFALAFSGALLILIGWVMGEAARIAEDNAQII